MSGTASGNPSFLSVRVIGQNGEEVDVSTGLASPTTVLSTDKNKNVKLGDVIDAALAALSKDAVGAKNGVAALDDNAALLSIINDNGKFNGGAGAIVAMVDPDGKLISVIPLAAILSQVLTALSSTGKANGIAQLDENAAVGKITVKDGKPTGGASGLNVALVNEDGTLSGLTPLTGILAQVLQFTQNRNKANGPFMMTDDGSIGRIGTYSDGTNMSLLEPSKNGILITVEQQDEKGNVTGTFNYDLGAALAQIVNSYVLSKTDGGSITNNPDGLQLSGNGKPLTLLGYDRVLNRVNPIVIVSGGAPASKTSAGLESEIRFDDNFMYRCIIGGKDGAASWVRFPIDTTW